MKEAGKIAILILMVICRDTSLSRNIKFKTNVHIREVGMAPYVELEPTDHPLAIEQRNGITLDRVKEIEEMIQRHN